MLTWLLKENLGEGLLLSVFADLATILLTPFDKPPCHPKKLKFFSCPTDSPLTWGTSFEDVLLLRSRPHPACQAKRLTNLATHDPFLIPHPLLTPSFSYCSLSNRCLLSP